jgi:Phosphomannomutase
MSLEEMRVGVDVANGAAYKSTPCVLRELGAEVAVAHNEPNGININDGCGSMHPEEIQRIVEVSGADVALVTTAMLIAFFFATRTARLSMAMKSSRSRRWIFWNPAGWSKTLSWQRS